MSQLTLESPIAPMRFWNRYFSRAEAKFKNLEKKNLINPALSICTYDLKMSIVTAALRKSIGYQSHSSNWKTKKRPPPFAVIFHKSCLGPKTRPTTTTTDYPFRKCISYRRKKRTDTQRSVRILLHSL